MVLSGEGVLQTPSSFPSEDLPATKKSGGIFPSVDASHLELHGTDPAPNKIQMR